MNRFIAVGGASLVLGTVVPAGAQDRGAVRLHALVNGLTVTARVLVIGARPGDADADLLARLSLGHHVQTGYLSLTRGESAPNYTGLETGATLGAVHVEELLAARRIDGAEQYFTRAYDFGAARNADDAFRRWDRTTLLADVVAVVRAFRPHVIVAQSRRDTLDRDGQGQASAIIARDVFDAALDTVRFPTKGFGLPWSPWSLYEPGPGIAMDSGAFDPVRGRSYADIAIESRAQLRSFGFPVAPWLVPRTMAWHRIATRVADAPVPDTGSSLFAGIDTSFRRLEADTPREMFRTVPRALITQLPGVLANADSARRNLDLLQPSRIIKYLKEVATLASIARTELHGCRHPSPDAAVSLRGYQPCEARWLDLDASLDLVQRRSAEALLLAAGVSFESVSDREFLANGDTASIAVTVFNNGDAPVSVNDITVSGAVPVRMTEPVIVPAHGRVRVDRLVTSIAYAHPWWIWKRDGNFFPYATTALDGVPRPGVLLHEFGIAGVAVPENIRRLSDVTATVTIGMTTVTSSIGPVVVRIADPVLGVRDRAMSGVPPVTLVFERALEWAQAGKPQQKQVRVTLRSFSDKPQQLALKAVAPTGIVRMDSLPASILLAPREAREVTIPLRGTPGAMRYDLGLIGVTRTDTFEVGFRTAQYSYLPPLHLFRGSTVSLLAVDIEIPSRLSVAYIRGAGDDADVALKGLGIPTYVLNTEGLIRADLEGLSTVVIGPDAFRVDRGLSLQMPRLTAFARKGGTVVILANPDAVAQPGIVPFPVSFARPVAEQVTSEDAPVVAVDPTARVLNWPNVIRGPDWTGWVSARAPSVPTTIDTRYALAIEVHDPAQKENRNGILVASVGKGRMVYTSLSLTQQISNAVPGAMRLFVNLLSAGLPRPAQPVEAGASAPAITRSETAHEPLDQ